MDIKIVMEMVTRFNKLSVMFADDIEQIIEGIHRVAKDNQMCEIDEEMSAVRSWAKQCRN